MKHMGRWILLLLVLVLMLCGCRHEGVRAPEYTVKDREGTVWTIDPKKRTITDGEDVFKFKILGDQQEYTLWIYYPGGEKYTQDLINGVVYENLRSISYPSFQFFTFDFLGFHYVNVDGPFGYPSGEELAALIHPLIPEEAPPKNLLLPFLLIALGCADILWPKIFWIPRYGNAFREVELSKRTQLIQNLAGTAAIVLGIVLLFV
jgi:hypothetical protein